MSESVSNPLSLSCVRDEVKVPGSSCQQYVQAVTVRWCGSWAFKQKHQNLRSMCLWLVPDAAPWMPQLMFLMESLLYKANQCFPLRSSHQCGKDHMAAISSLAWKTLFLPFPDPSTKTHELKCHFCLDLDINFHNKQK